MYKNYWLNWTDAETDKWYTFFNAETAITSGISVEDLKSGIMKYTKKIRTHLVIVKTVADANDMA